MRVGWLAARNIGPADTVVATLCTLYCSGPTLASPTQVRSWLAPAASSVAKRLAAFVMVLSILTSANNSAGSLWRQNPEVGGRSCCTPQRRSTYSFFLTLFRRLIRCRLNVLGRGRFVVQRQQIRPSALLCCSAYKRRTSRRLFFCGKA